MTSWYPGSGSAEVLSHGGDEPRPRRGHLVAAAMALLVVGAGTGAGVASGLHDQLPWGGPAAAVPALTGGFVEVAPALTDRHRYEVALFNPGPDAVRGVRVVGVVGRTVTVAPGRPVTIGPREWRPVSFSLPDECGSPSSVLARAVRVRTDGAGGSAETEQEVGLEKSAAALRDNHEHECVRAAGLTRKALGGLWILEDAEGTWGDLARIGLMRFTSDGRFTFDPEGWMFSEGDQGWVGVYLLRGSRLVLHGEGGYACEPGFTEAWRTTPLSRDLLRLDAVRSDPGYCHTPRGERWILRRLVPEKRLPPVEAPVSSRRP